VSILCFHSTSNSIDDLYRSSLHQLPLANLLLPLLRIYLLCAIGYFLSPLWRPKDDMSDIDLTPMQRQLLGLPPSSAPPTPGSAYITPPRYTRSTPQSSGSRAAIFGSSPFDRSTSGSPISGSPLAGRGTGSPYGLSGYGTSPANGSPLVRKAVEGRRWSAGGSGLRDSIRGSELGSPDSPSPTAQRGASVSLNSKWLYQRGKGSPGGRALYS
jgi:nucleoporin POM34